MEKEFYILNAKLSKKQICFSSEGISWVESVKIFKNEVKEDIDSIVLLQTDGSEYSDFVVTTSALKLVSERFEHILIKEKITGWRTCKVMVLDKQGNKIEGYKLFVITGKCGKIDKSKSEVVERKLTPFAPISYHYKGLFFERDSWDGSDIFIPDGTIFVFTTNRVKKILTKNKITNVEFTDVAEILQLKQ